MLASAALLALLPSMGAQDSAQIDEEIVTHRFECSARKQLQTTTKRRQARPKSIQDAPPIGNAARNPGRLLTSHNPASHEDRFALNGIGAPLRC